MSKEENNYNSIGDPSKKTVDWSKIDTIDSQVKYRGSGINTSNTFERGVKGCKNSISTHWLFIMNDDSTYGTTTDDFKAAIVKLADYTGLNSPLFNKCINGFLNDDIEGLIQLFNQFSYYNIEQVYDVKKKLWSI